MEILYFALYILLIVIIGIVLFKINSAEDYKKNVRKKRLLLLALVIISLVVFFIVERGFPSNFFSFSALFSMYSQSLTTSTCELGNSCGIKTS